MTTVITPVERVVAALCSGGYRILPTPLRLASIDFDADAALLATGKAADVVLVLDTVRQTANEIRAIVVGIARALDVLQSLRPITVVLVGPRPESDILEKLSRVSRVLPVGEVLASDSEKGLPEWLAVLLPLRLPRLAIATRAPSSVLEGYLGHVLLAEAGVGALLTAALEGEEAVQAELGAQVEALCRTGRAS